MTYPLLLLYFVAELGPRVWLATQRHVAREGTLLLLHHADLEETNERDDLEESERGELRQRSQTVGHIREREVGRGREHAREAEVLLDEVASHGQHRNAAVLDLHVPKAVKPERDAATVWDVGSLSTAALIVVLEELRSRRPRSFGPTPVRWFETRTYAGRNNSKTC